MTTKPKKRKKKATGTQIQKGHQQNRVDTDDGSIHKLISVALKSQKKHYKNHIIQSVKSDLMNTLRSRIVQQQRGKKTGGSAYDDGGGEVYDNDGVDGSASIDKQYHKRINKPIKTMRKDTTMLQNSIANSTKRRLAVSSQNLMK